MPEDSHSGLVSICNLSMLDVANLSGMSTTVTLPYMIVGVELMVYNAGNGVQKAFYDDPNVLYISIHVHMDGRFYPSGPNGDHLHCGTGAGVGK